MSDGLDVSQFVTPEQSMRGLDNASWGGVAVVLHNGAVHRVVPVGKRFSRGWRAPALGALTYVEVNAELIKGTFLLKDVPTRDGFVLPQVGSEATFRFDRRAGYEHLEGLVEQFGRSFGEVLRGQVTDQVDYLVRSRLSSQSHSELFGVPYLQMLGNIPPQPLAGGVYELFSVRLTDVVYDGRYRVVQGAGADIAAVRAQGEVGVVSVQELERQNAAQLNARINELRPLAAELGIPVEFLADPQRRSEWEGRKFDFAAQLLDPGNRALIARNPQLLDLIQELMSTPTAAPVARSVTSGGAGVSRVVAAAEGVSVHSISTMPEGTTSPPTQPLPTLSNAPADDESDLTVDRRLQRVWESLGLPAIGLVGLAGATRGNRGIVVAAAEVPGGVVPDSAPAAFARVQRCDSTDVVLVRPGPLLSVVRQWFVQLSGQPCTDIALDLHVAEFDGLDVLTVAARGPGASALVRALTEVDSLALPVLENLLPFGMVELTTADG